MPCVRYSIASRAVLALLLLAGLLPAARADDAKPLTKLRFQLATAPSGSDAPYYLARDEGLYAKEGLDVEIIPGRSSQDAINAVVTGNAFVATTLGANLILSVAHGQSVLSIGGRYAGELQGITAAKDAGIATLADIKNKQVLVSASGFQIIFNALLKRAGVDPTTNHYVLIPEPHVMSTTYIAGKGDAMINVVPYAQAVIGDARASTYFTFEKVGDPEPGYIFITTPKNLQASPDLLRRFLRATYAAHKIANENMAQALAIVAKDVPGTNEKAAATLMRAYQPFACSQAEKGMPRGREAASDWRQAIDLYRQVGLIDHPIDAAGIFTNQFFDGPDSVAAETCPAR